MSPVALFNGPPSGDTRPLDFEEAETLTRGPFGVPSSIEGGGETATCSSTPVEYLGLARYSSRLPATVAVATHLASGKITACI
jgi:hypothetical protein